MINLKISQTPVPARRIQMSQNDEKPINSTDELIDVIVAKVCALFKEADCPEDKEAEELSDQLNAQNNE